MKEFKDKDFIKLYRKFIAELSDLGQQDDRALTVLLFLCKNMDGTNAISISMETIAHFVNMSRQTVSQKIRFLEKEGWIQRFKFNSGTYYVVNDAVAWTSYGDQHSMCKFTSTVLDVRTKEKGDPWKLEKKNVIHPRTILLDRIDQTGFDELEYQAEDEDCSND